MQPTSHKTLYFVIAGVILLLVLLVSALYFFGSKSLFTKKADPTDSFYDSQSAMVLGKVTAVGTETITVENKKGVSKELPLSKTLTILTVDEKGMATTSSDLKKLETGKTFSLNLVSGSEGQLEVTNVMPDLISTPAIMPPVDGAPPAVAPAPVAPPPAPATPAASRRPASSPAAEPTDEEN